MKHRTVAAATIVLLAGLTCGMATQAAVIPASGADLAWDASTETPADSAWDPHIATAVLPAGKSRAWQVGTGASNLPTLDPIVPGLYTPDLTAAYRFVRSQGDRACGIVDGSVNASQFFQYLTNNPTDSSASFEMWLRPASLTGGSQVLLESGGSGAGFALLLENANLRLQAKDSDTNGSLDVVAVVKAALTTDDIRDFVHVVGVIDMATGASDETVALYVNGQKRAAVADSSSGLFLDATTPTQLNAPANPLDAHDTATPDPNTDLRDWDGGDAATLGGEGGTNGGTGNGGLNITGAGSFNGRIAAVNFYDRALSDAEVQANFDQVWDPTPDTSAIHPGWGTLEASHVAKSATFPLYGGGLVGVDSVPKTPVFTTMLTYPATQDAVARNTAATQGSVSVMADEPKSSVDGGAHGTETFGYLAVDPVTSLNTAVATDFGGLKAYRGMKQFGVTTSRITFPEAFDGVPVVLADMVTIAGADPSYVRVYNVDETGFDLQIDETQFDGGTSWGHATENVAWLAVEQGVFHFGSAYGEARVVDHSVVAAVGLNHATAADQAAAFVPVTFLDPLAIGTHTLVGNLYFDTGAVGGSDPNGDAFAYWRLKDLTAAGFSFAVENPIPYDDGDFYHAPHFAYIAMSLPEPATLTLLALGALGLAARRRRT